MKQTFYTILIGLAFSSNVLAQCDSPNQMAKIETRTLLTTFTNGGDLWGDTSAKDFGLEYPKRSIAQIQLGQKPKRCLFAGGLWMSSYNNGILKSSTITYRGQNKFLLSPGPIRLSTGIPTNSSCKTFNKIWQVSKAEIVNFQNTFVSGSSPMSAGAIPISILTWPAKGNRYYNTTDTIKDDLAPFHDINNNGIYDPENGDYPKIKGDMAYFTVMNDLGISSRIGVELHLMAYTIDLPITENTIFYNLKITKKSQGDAEDFIFGLFVDNVLGNTNQDLIGCDTIHNMGYTYNGDSADKNVSDSGIESKIPVVACKFLNQKMGSFSHFINVSGSPISDPSTDVEFRNVMEGKLRTGGNMTIGGSGINGSVITKYAFHHDPCDPSGWSMLSQILPLRDIRFYMSTNPRRLAYNTPENYNFKVTVFPQNSWPPCIKNSVISEDSMILKVNDSSTKCDVRFANIKVSSDTNNSRKGSISLQIAGSQNYQLKWSSGETNLQISQKLAGQYKVTVMDANGCFSDTTLHIPNKSSANLLSSQNNEIRVFPIPFQDKLTVELNKHVRIHKISIVNVLGQPLRVLEIDSYISKYDIALKDIPSGNYLIRIEGKDLLHNQTITKE